MSSREERSNFLSTFVMAEKNGDEWNSKASIGPWVARSKELEEKDERGPGAETAIMVKKRCTVNKGEEVSSKKER